MAEPLLILAIWLAVVGSVVGCFTGLVSLRLPAGEPIIGGRSRCGGCARPLRPIQLVPLASYALSGGRCRSCHSRIPLRYPLIELGCAVIGVWASVSQPSVAAAVLTAILGWQLLLISVIDGEHMWLPDELTLPLAASGLLAAMVLPDIELLDAARGMAIGFGSLWLLARAYRALRGREGLGGGDPFMLGACGAWVGLERLPSVVLVAALVGLSLALSKGLLERRLSSVDRIPFGPMLALGAWWTWLT